MKKNILVLLLCITGYYFLITLNFGCAQISAPTGGAKDTLPPALVKASPEQNTINFRGNKVSLSFDEYIDLQELQGNVLISPLQKTNPNINFNLKSISVKFKDTLLPNTTYSINFGNSIKDVHEGNILKDFTYVFSTGNTIDSLSLEGKIILAETGTPDSTIIAMLYRNNLDDTAVLKTRPDYIAKLNGEGKFKFKNLPDADFNIYALKDGDGGKTYNAKTELFAFTGKQVNSLRNTDSIILFAYAEKKADDKPGITLKVVPEKKLRYTTNLDGVQQDLLQTFDLTFNNPLRKFDTSRSVLTDSNYNRIANYTITLDSTRKKVSLKTSWLPDSVYYFILPKETAEDSSANYIARTDTIRFTAKKTTDYGKILLRFSNLDLAKHPIIQFMEGADVKFSYPVTAMEWSNTMFTPGDYGIRILYDLNNNGIWDPGNYSKKQQPEIAISLPQKISIKADWDNERDIKL